jgi:hypothetical protein
VLHAALLNPFTIAIVHDGELHYEAMLHRDITPDGLDLNVPWPADALAQPADLLDWMF